MDFTHIKITAQILHSKLVALYGEKFSIDLNIDAIFQEIDIKIYDKNCNDNQVQFYYMLSTKGKFEFFIKSNCTEFVGNFTKVLEDTNVLIAAAEIRFNTFFSKYERKTKYNLNIDASFEFTS